MVTVEYVKTGKRKQMKPVFADALVKVGAVVVVQEAAAQVQTVTRDVVPEDISPRTGKPKRQYKRRDMRAED